MSDEDDIEAVRDWVGATPDDGTIVGVVARAGSPHAAALSILRRRRADILAAPAVLSEDGGLSRTWTENLSALAAQISRLEGIVGEAAAGPTGAAVTVGRLTRDTPGR